MATVSTKVDLVRAKSYDHDDRQHRHKRHSSSRRHNQQPQLHQQPQQLLNSRVDRQHSTRSNQVSPQVPAQSSMHHPQQQQQQQQGNHSNNNSNTSSSGIDHHRSRHHHHHHHHHHLTAAPSSSLPKPQSMLGSLVQSAQKLLDRYKKLATNIQLFLVFYSALTTLAASTFQDTIDASSAPPKYSYSIATLFGLLELLYSVGAFIYCNYTIKFEKTQVFYLALFAVNLSLIGTSFLYTSLDLFASSLLTPQ